MFATLQGLREEEEGERMNRVVDNNKILQEIDSLTKILLDSDLDAFQVMNVNMTTAATFLCDISKSLAVIADAMEKENGWWIVQKSDVLGKIRAEIDSHCSDNRDRNDGLYIAMKIIDKYKAEGEDKK